MAPMLLRLLSPMTFRVASSVAYSPCAVAATTTPPPRCCCSSSSSSSSSEEELAAADFSEGRGSRTQGSNRVIRTGLVLGQQHPEVKHNERRTHIVDSARRFELVDSAHSTGILTW
jgi:hypothetical protein